ncbi:hypothetical protein NUW58_g1913 [Xylaria curta]|uniref:Uncharacterized protein n=1 Tax=Xylaria curta TaxID=42375 RepID=A0ACC1PLC9_9PEZI|nr:hypothetical protein NUW58_g1913 [Xylaria curta]
MAALSVHQTFHASRIEVGDIEATITANVDISEAVVVSRDDRLIAYCVRMREGGVSISPKSKPPLDKLLRPWLAERLPLYMIPAFFLELEKLHTTLNNKINRKALLDPAEVVRPDVVTAMPKTEMERRILSIWSNVLDLSTARIGVYDNFFHIGGNSLRVVRAQKQIEQLVKRPLSVARMYEHSTIQSLAAYLTTTLEAKPEPDSSRRRPKDTKRGNRRHFHGMSASWRSHHTGRVLAAARSRR